MSVADLRGILTYVPRFREKIFVVAMDGSIIAHENFPNILLDLAVLRSLNIHLVLVHGAGHQVKELAQKTGVTISNHHGIGVTDEETLNVSMTAANRVTHEILEGLSSSDIRACCTNAVIAHPYGIVQGVNHQYTGRVERVDVGFLHQLLEKDIVPVIPPLGFDGDGKTYRVNSDGVAQKVAEVLKAAKLIYISEYPGISNGKKLMQLSVFEAEDYLKKKRSELPLELALKFEHCVKACQNGVSRSHLIDGRIDEALLSEVFSAEGVGTMIYANEYQAIRQAKKKDVRAIQTLIRNSVQAEELVKRTRQTILAQIEDYYVFETDRTIVGCVAIHTYPEQQVGEMACLFVSSTNENQGIGGKLMRFLDPLAREKGLKAIFALSTQAFNYFSQKGGFKEVSPDFLPPIRREKYDQSGRNSKVLWKEIQPL